MARLSSDDIQFFKDSGYLVKRGVLKPELTERARNHLWDNAPPQLDRDDPNTWVGPFTEENENDDKADLRRGYRWNFRRPGREDWMIRLLATDPDVYGMAEEMIGEGKLQEPKRIRGIYCTLPYGDVEERGTGCHVDGHPFHLGVVGYIDDVPPRGGSFCVWPGSHTRFYPTFTSQYKTDSTDEYEAIRKQTNEEPPVDCYGNAGDIVFWHHRIGHMAGHNYSRQIRQAVLYDFRKIDLEVTQEEPPCEDMWRDWEGVPS